MKKLYYYPDNMASKATMWLWELRDIAVIGIGLPYLIYHGKSIYFYLSKVLSNFA